MKPILLGMNNPLSDDPRCALFPHPPRCTGHRVQQMLETHCGLSQRDYLALFDRRNLLVGEWSPRRARLAGGVLRVTDALADRSVAVLGRGVWVALGLPADTPPLDRLQRYDAMLLYVPHPSGRNLWYNDPACRARAASAIYSLLEPT